MTVWAGLLSIFINAINQTKEVVVLKLDFEKAFDITEQQAILDILIAKGFGRDRLDG